MYVCMYVRACVCMCARMCVCVLSLRLIYAILKKQYILCEINKQNAINNQ